MCDGTLQSDANLKIKSANLLGKNLFGWTSSKAPGISVFTLNILLILFIESGSSITSYGIGVPNSITFS